MSTDSRNRLSQLEPRYATGMRRAIAVLIDLLAIMAVMVILLGPGEYGVLPFVIAFAVTAPTCSCGKLVSAVHPVSSC